MDASDFRDNMKTYIYALCEPSGEVRYIGKADNPKQRFQKHLRNAIRGAATYKNNWLRSLMARGQMPVLKILKRVSKRKWQNWEKLFISRSKESGCRLVNLTEGGEGTAGLSPSPAARAKLSRFFRGRKLSEEHILKVRKALVGHSVSEATRQKIRQAKLGKCASAATRLKMSETRSGRALSAAHCEAIRRGLIGKAKSAEHKKNLSLAAQRRMPRQYRLRKDATSGFKGVSLERGGKWRAYLRVGGRRIYVGTHASPQAAALAHDCASESAFGKKAVLNFPKLLVDGDLQPENLKI